MHISGHLITDELSAAMALVSICAAGAALYKCVKSEKKPGALRFALVSAFIFALQMINFKISGGTSGHMLGAAFAVVLLGLPFAIVSMASVILVQSLVFADGAVSALGANIFNMAVVASVVSYLVYRFTNGKISVILAGFFSVMVAQFFCSVELSVSSLVLPSVVFSSMAKAHIASAVAEGMISLVLVYSVRKFIHADEKKSNMPYVLAGFIIAALALSPFASSLPDGLEFVSSTLGFAKESIPLFTAPLAGYEFSDITSSGISAFIAGSCGVMIVILSVTGIFRLAEYVSSRRKAVAVKVKKS